MCDTNEHMLIGETAASWLPQLLQQVTTAFGNAADYSADALGGVNVFGSGGWFNEFQTGQFKFGSKDIEWASYGDILALSGDYFGSEAAIAAQTSTVDALIKAWHEKLKVPKSTMVDPDESEMIVRAMQNWPHFGFEAVELWLQVHREAIQMAIDGRNGKFDANDVTVKDQGFTPVVAGLMLALRHNAFGDHYLSDLFSAGHMRVARLGFYDFLNPGHPDRQKSPWLVAGTSAFTDGKQDSDVASIVSGISHDEDGLWGLWCTLLHGDCGVNALGGVTAVSGHHSDPDDPNGSLAISWEAPLQTASIGSFYARGDDGLSDPNNVTTRALCYYTIGLSIRDILIASVTGKDPSDAGVQSTLGYWDAVGGKPDQPPLYAALRLIPRPDEPASDWQDAKSNLGGLKNHSPLLMPDYGISTYYDMLKAQMCGSSFNRPASFTMRGTTDTLGGVSYSHGDYSPGSTDYFDFLAHLQNGDPTARIDAEPWRAMEYTRMVERYGRYKGPGGIAEKEEIAKRKAAATTKKLEDSAEAAEKKAESLEGAAKQKLLDQAQALRDRKKAVEDRLKSYL